MEESLFMDDIRTFFAMLDRMIYSLISIFYNTITDLATVQIIDTNTINGLTGKVYALLGIFMIFKVSFSLINYIVDPDKLADKAKGGGALIKNIAITIVLIITVPFAFDLLYEAQSAILTDQIIPKFIFNSESADVDSVKNSTTYQINLDPDVCASPAETTNMGDYIGLLIFNPFFVQETENVNENKSLANNESLRGYYCNSSSVKILLGNSDLYNAPKGWSTKYNYSIDYSFLLSTSIGVVVALLFLGFCFDVAVRMLKLFLLEIIAPIPIISYIDPDSSKNGMFKKWLKEVFNTWLSLFLRLGAVFLAVFVIQSIVASSNNLDEYSHPLWLRILIIIGALIFAKQLPKMLEDILGIKMSGSMKLNPFKKISEDAIGGKTIGKVTSGLIGGTAGMIGGGIAGFKAGSQVGDTTRGTLLGALSGAKNGANSPKGAFAKSMDSTYKQMTGNEMNKLSVSKMMLANSGNQKVQEIKDYLKTANEQLRTRQSDLNDLSYQSSNLSNQLRLSKIDTANMGSMQELSAQRTALHSSLSSAESSYRADEAKYNDAKAQYDAAKSYIDNFKPSAILDANGRPSNQAEKDRMEKIISSMDLNALESNYRKSQDSYKQTLSSYELLNQQISYLDIKQQATNIREEINSIERDIKQLGDEKSQRQRYYQTDSSPKKDVEKSMRNVDNRR